jgi:hypothetical protein
MANMSSIEQEDICHYNYLWHGSVGGNDVLGDRGSIPAGLKYSSVVLSLQTGSEPHPASYTMDIGGKAAGV